MRNKKLIILLVVLLTACGIFGYVFLLPEKPPRPTGKVTYGYTLKKHQHVRSYPNTNDDHYVVDSISVNERVEVIDCDYYEFGSKTRWCKIRHKGQTRYVVNVGASGNVYFQVEEP